MPVSPDEDKNTLVQGALDYLGRDITVPLTGGQDISAGVQGLPALATPGGQPGGAMGFGPGGRVGSGGPSSLGLATGALEAAVKTGKFGKEFLPERGGDVAYDPIAAGAATVPGIEAARGLTSAPLSAIDLGLGGGLGAPNVPTSFGDLSKLVGQGYSMEDIGQILGGAEAVGTGGAGAAGAGAGGALGLAGGGGAALGAILALLAQVTGDPNLAKAAQATGAAANVASLGGTAAALPGVVAGGTAGIGTAAGAAFAPIAAALLIDAIGQMAGKEEGTLGIAGGIADMMKRTAGDYPFFTEKLGQNLGQQRGAFGTLEQALPYVQSKEELGQLLNTYRNYLGTTTGITPESYGSIEGAPGGVYSIGKIPGAGVSTHGQPTPGGAVDFGPQTRALMDQVSQLYGVLPGKPITAGYGEPGGGLEGEAGRRLWQQFFPQGGEVASRTVGGGPGFWEGTSFYPQPGTQQFATYTGAGSPYEYFAQPDITNAMAAGTMQGPSWDPATGQMVYTRGAAPPKPSDFFQVAPYMAQLRGQRSAQLPIAQQINAMVGGGVAPAGGAPQGGFLSEEERRRLGQ